MPKKVVATMIAILATLAFLIGTAFAAVKTITGEVVSAEPLAKVLVINTGATDMTFRMTKKAAMLISHIFTDFLEEQEMAFNVVEHATGALANLRPGDKVTVSYTEADGTLTAQSITKD
ncbi:hypothetical protein MELA_00052 [Candidatus Methylomirabilis lanthanidiphila]|uniref:DUF5666 domain-containing protein n=1 Tax=Candidatus Methylomirabilis lanthanidiphila TaxID=2211376 RepID=A0A564ZEF3_9BACT|nr:hypothetical protein [Candidatus Methylomirabilis lanthanidiphila]VUZ83699.1 hypothetical protein MELA_00052 [Candidatus Methylomirabilis lanthanidiphila]